MLHSLNICIIWFMSHYFKLSAVCIYYLECLSRIFTIFPCSSFTTFAETLVWLEGQEQYLRKVGAAASAFPYPFISATGYFSEFFLKSLRMDPSAREFWPMASHIRSHALQVNIFYDHEAGSLTPTSCSCPNCFVFCRFLHEKYYLMWVNW